MPSCIRTDHNRRLISCPSISVSNRSLAVITPSLEITYMAGNCETLYIIAAVDDAPEGSQTLIHGNSCSLTCMTLRKDRRH